jgi:predicted aconitase with swiveling domain
MRRGGLRREDGAMSDRIVKGHIGIGSAVTANAIVARDDFSARYDLDRLQGIFSRPAHLLHGESYVGKVLVLNTAKGGVATAWMLYEMKSRNMAPAALLLNASNPIMAQGAALAGLPFMDRFEADITEAISTGDKVTVDPVAGTVTIHE